MYKIKITTDTILKINTKQSKELDDKDKKFTFIGTEYKVNKLEIVDNHYKINIEGLDWYLYSPHCTIKNLSNNEVILDVPYLSQRDNTIRPNQTCNVTSCAMVIKYYYPTLQYTGQLEDVLTNKLISKYGRDSIYYHNRLVEILEEYGVKSVFNTVTKFDDVKKHLDTGNPVIYSGKFTGSGHIIVIIGYDDKGFIVNDPYGEWFSTGYQNKSGAKLHYSYDLISRVSYSGKDAGWCHLCTKINEPTNPLPTFTSNLTNIPKQALEIIKKFEGMCLNAYICPANVITIGIGTTIYPNGDRVKMGDQITEKEALEYLDYEITKNILPKLEVIPNWSKMNDNQRSALISFAYNLGSNFYKARNFESITKVCDESDKWNNKQWIEEQFIKYRNPGSSFEQGLLSRRKAEADLFCS